MKKTHVSVQRIHSAQKQGGFKAKRIRWCRSRNWSSLEIATVIDVPGIEDVLGIEVQVPSLSSPGYSVWFWQVVITKDLWTKFIVTTLTLWITVPRRAQQKKTSITCVSIRIFQTCRGKSRARLTRFEQCRNEGWIFKRASAPASSNCSSGGSSHPTSVHPKANSIYKKKEIQVGQIWTGL